MKHNNKQEAKVEAVMNDVVPSDAAMKAAMKFVNKNLDVFDDLADRRDTGKLVAGIAKFAEYFVALSNASTKRMKAMLDAADRIELEDGTVIRRGVIKWSAGDDVPKHDSALAAWDALKENPND